MNPSTASDTTAPPLAPNDEARQARQWRLRAWGALAEASLLLLLLLGVSATVYLLLGAVCCGR